MMKDRWDTEIKHFFIVTPESHTVKSTAWLPKEALDEIYGIYKKVWRNHEICFDLVDNFKKKDN